MEGLAIFIGGSVPIRILTADEYCKNAVSTAVIESSLPFVVFVWRQLESAFFSALTSVGALFIFMGGKRNDTEENPCNFVVGSDVLVNVGMRGNSH